MKKSMERIGYFIAKASDVESGMSTTNPQKDIPLSFYFTIAMDGTTLDVISAMSNIIDMGCLPIALLMHDVDSDEYSMWTSRSLPEWLHSVLSNCAPSMTHNPLNGEIGDYN